MPQSYSNGDRVEPPSLAEAEYLASKPYRERRLIFHRKVRPRLPRFLYKYKSLDSSDAIEHLRQIVIDSDLWLSSPRDFNDPYDTSGKPSFEGTEAQRKKRIRRLIDMAGGLTREVRRAKERELLNKPHSFWIDLIQSSLNNQRARVGVACFATDPRSILMWSHYTSKHAGVCLQFEVARDPVKMSRAIPVIYTNDYPVLDWVSDDDNESMMRVLLHKFAGWKYEGEHRMILVGHAYKKLRFDPSALVGIIFGCEASDDTIEKVRSLVVERDRLGLPRLKVFQAQKHDSRYAIRVLARP